MGIAPFTHKTLHERLADLLEELIVTGELRAGSPIPSERELAERFQVSRAAVRDATRLLAARGLVAVRRGVGTIVTSGGAGFYRDSLKLLFRRGDYSRDDLLDLRRHIEVELAARLAESGAPAAVDRLASLVAEMRAAIDTQDRQTVELYHLQFHLALAEATGNQALQDVIGPLIGITFDLTMTDALRSSPPTWDEYVDHAAIVEAIRAGDVEGARRAMRCHLDAVYPAQ